MPASGRPVSHALEIPPGFLSAELRDVVRAIDTVHGDGALPRISLGWVSWLDGDGFYRIDEVTAEPVRIIVNALASRRRLATLHEVGHFLDHHGIGRAGSFASTRSRLLRPWREAVRTSKAIRHLRMLEDVGIRQDVKLEREGVQIRVRDDYVRYLLAYNEVWARSYAQFIASRSGDPLLLSDLESTRATLPGTIDYHIQWDDEDFLPIAAEIERLFRRIGWLA